MLDRLETKYAQTQGAAPAALGDEQAGLPQGLANTPVNGIERAFNPAAANDDPTVSKDATPDDADWPFFAQASAVENKGMVPGLDYPQGVQEPNSYTPQALAGSLSSITDDIRQREASWNNLVNAGEQEWARRENAGIRERSAAKIHDAELRAAAAVHSAYVSRATSNFQGVLMHNQVRQAVMDAKWDEARAQAKAAAAQRQAAMLEVVNAATKAKAADTEAKYEALKRKAHQRIHELHTQLRALRASEAAQKTEAARQEERAKLAKEKAAAGSSKAAKAQGKVDSLLSRLGDARAGLAWLSAKLGAAKDDTSSEKETSAWWQKKAESASKRARTSEHGEQDALSRARQANRKAKRHMDLEKAAQAKELSEQIGRAHV